MIVDLPTTANPVSIIEDDCLDVLRSLPEECVDAVVTDPPYGLEFMNKAWDRLAVVEKATDTPNFRSGTGLPSQTGAVPFGGSGQRVRYGRAGRNLSDWHGRWAAATLRVLKPGGYMLAFGGTRTYHRLACAVEDVGFEVRDCIMWVYCTGFPKGQGTLKPAWEPILLARKPGKRVLPLGINECRIAHNELRNTARKRHTCGQQSRTVNDGRDMDKWEASHSGEGRELLVSPHPDGRYPTNILCDGSDEVKESLGGLAQYFYCTKASKAERVSAADGTKHPTVKPVKLMRWLVKLVCPPGGLVLDPFAGSGTTLVAAVLEGRRAIGIECNPAYAEIARRRVAAALGAASLFAEAGG